jgi:hypothetical protein
MSRSKIKNNSVLLESDDSKSINQLSSYSTSTLASPHTSQQNRHRLKFSAKNYKYLDPTKRKILLKNNQTGCQSIEIINKNVNTNINSFSNSNKLLSEFRKSIKSLIDTNFDLMKHDCEREKNKKLIYNNLTLNKNVTCFSILSQKVLDESEYNEEHYREYWKKPATAYNCKFILRIFKFFYRRLPY